MKTKGEQFAHDTFVSFKGSSNANRNPPTQNEFAFHHWIIERMTKDVDVQYEAEVRLSGSDRPDFVVTLRCGYRLAIEAKCKGTAMAATRQAMRYAAHQSIDEVLILTTKPFIIPVENYRRDDGTEIPITICELWTAGL